MPDEKIKFLMRIDPATDRKIKAAMPMANCRSQNEFVEKALQFYCDYAVSQDCFSVLPPMLVAAIRSTVQGSENHICPEYCPTYWMASWGPWANGWDTCCSSWR